LQQARDLRFRFAPPKKIKKWVGRNASEAKRAQRLGSEEVEKSRNEVVEQPNDEPFNPQSPIRNLTAPSF
jgi:hypothetical protein